MCSQQLLPPPPPPDAGSTSDSVRWLAPRSNLPSASFNIFLKIPATAILNHKRMQKPTFLLATLCAVLLLAAHARAQGVESNVLVLTETVMVFPQSHLPKSLNSNFKPPPVACALPPNLKRCNPHPSPEFHSSCQRQPVVRPRQFLQAAQRGCSSICHCCCTGESLRRQPPHCVCSGWHRAKPTTRFEVQRHQRHPHLVCEWPTAAVCRPQSPVKRHCFLGAEQD